MRAIASAHATPDGPAGRILSPLASLSQHDLLLLKKLLESRVEAMGLEWERTAELSRLLDAVVAELDQRGSTLRPRGVEVLHDQAQE